MQLQGKTFLVSGGSSGLGAACVREFAGAGANVVICDVSEPREAASGESAGRVRFQKTDVTSEADVQAAIALAFSAFGELHGAICCAGIATAERVVG
ncbi:MAG TPA: SDR family NAD(P)-dependent oxidoreductase, partial [Candidatus Baltobacteraceae bacterium]|nr:SDR family NAD(P)-dependent oxidoreductase [Candidatus Baltobacteraceae bacterium]